MSVLEVVLLAPVVVGFLMILVDFGVLVDARGTVQGAARDAARAGSLQRDHESADAAASAAAAADIGNTCAATVTQVDPDTKQPTTVFDRGQLYTIEVSCTVSMAGLDWFGLGDKTLVSYSTAPLDTFRRTGGG
jgi:Flp pilus assembly protein TadG